MLYIYTRVRNLIYLLVAIRCEFSVAIELVGSCFVAGSMLELERAWLTVCHSMQVRFCISSGLLMCVTSKFTSS